MPKSRPVSALCAFFVLTLVLAACGGGGMPGDAVVTVGDKTIKKQTFQHWLTVAAIAQAGQTGQTVTPATVKLPDPPEYTKCVADKKKTAPKPAKGQPVQNETQFKSACKSEYETLRDQVLTFLISAEWVAGEAADLDVKLTDKEIKKQFDDTKKQSFPKEADFTKFLKTSGYTINDLLFQVKNEQLQTKIQTKVTKGKDTVTPAQIAAYYNKNKSKFAQPERRDLRIIQTKTEANAKRAQSQLEAGVNFSKVAKALSIDQNSKSQGGVMLAIPKGQQEKKLDDAVFSATKGELTGPLKTTFGYYLFKVQKITKATQQTLKEATPTIKQLLASQNQQGALTKFVKDFKKKWKDRTDCRGGFKTTDCKGEKDKPETPAGGQTQAPPTGAAPDGSQQVPVTP